MKNKSIVFPNIYFHIERKQMDVELRTRIRQNTFQTDDKSFDTLI